MTNDDVYLDLINHLAVAEQKHPVFADNVLQGIAHIGEEYGELCQSINHKEPNSRINEEALDLLTVAWRFVRGDCSSHDENKKNTDITDHGMRGQILIDALKIINGDRQDEYGKPENNFSRIAKFWSLYLGRHISAYDVAMLMTLFKFARIMHSGNSRDSFIDLCGYAALGADMQHSKPKD